MLKKIPLILCICGGVILDQLSKLLVMQKLSLYQTVQIFDTKFFGLNLFLTYNSGAAFGFLHKASGWQKNLFIFIAIIIIISILLLFFKNIVNSNLEKWGFVLILSGAFGNLIDRIVYGYVIDFIDAYIQIKEQTMHWFTFNVADSLICIGVLLLLCSYVLYQSQFKLRCR